MTPLPIPLVSPEALPEEIHKGAAVMIGEELHLITHVEEIRDPWTQLPALKARISPAISLVFLVLHCDKCGRRLAVKYADLDSLDWFLVRSRGVCWWLCGKCW